MDGMAPHLCCAGCGSRIGIYEPLLWRLPDGSVIEAGWLAVREDVRAHHPASVFYHRGCLSDDQDLGGS
jgi:hypothetical protein